MNLAQAVEAQALIMSTSKVDTMPIIVAPNFTIPAAYKTLGGILAKGYKNFTNPTDATFDGNFGDIFQVLHFLGHGQLLINWLPEGFQIMAEGAPQTPSLYQLSVDGREMNWDGMIRDLVDPLAKMGVKFDDRDLVDCLELLCKACQDEAEFLVVTTAIKPLAMPQQFKDWANVIKPFQRRLSNRTWEERGNGGDRQGSNPKERYQRLINDLKQVRQESNTGQRHYLLAELAKHYGQSLPTIRAILASLDDESVAPAKQDWSFDELLSLSDDAVTWLIPGFIPRGELLLLSAAPKVGKTLLASHICLAILTGGEVLQTKCQQGKVLYVTSDESIKSVARRLKGTGFDLLGESLRPNFRVFTDFDITHQGPLQERLNNFKPDFVVFDSLTSISRRSGLSENDAEFARPIYQLRDLLASVDAAGILIHHDNKSKEARGMEKMSGSLRIAAAAWGHWQLIRDINDPDRRLLSITPREMEPSQHRLTINPKPQWHERGIYSYDSEVGDETGEKRSQAQQILDLLSNGDRLTVQEIGAKVYCSNIYTVLNRLEGQISSDYDAAKRKVYFLPRTDNSDLDFSQTPPPITNSPKNCYSTLQTQTEKEIQPNNKSTNILLTSQLTSQLTSADFQVGGGESTATDPEPVLNISNVETAVNVYTTTTEEAKTAIADQPKTQHVADLSEEGQKFNPGDLVVEVTRPNLLLALKSIDDDGEYCRCLDVRFDGEELCLLADLIPAPAHLLEEVANG